MVRSRERCGGLGSFGALLLLFSLSRRRRRCLVSVCDHSQSRVAWLGGANNPRLKKARRPPPLGRGDKRETEKRVLYVQARDGFGVTEWGGLQTDEAVSDVELARMLCVNVCGNSGWLGQLPPSFASSEIESRLVTQASRLRLEISPSIVR